MTDEDTIRCRRASAQVERNTKETQIAVERRTSTARGRAELATGVPFLDHMLDQVARHGMIDLDGRGEGRPAHRRAPHRRGRRHHARPGGQRRRSATRRASRRYGHAYVPLDEALSRVVIDLSGRPGLEFHVAVHARR